MISCEYSHEGHSFFFFFFFFPRCLVLCLKVYWKAYLALFCPPDEEKKYKKGSAVSMQITILWAEVWCWSISAKNRKLNLTFSPCKMNSKWDNNLFNNWFWPFIFSFFSFFKSLWSCLRSCHFGYNTFFPFFLLPLFIAFLKSFYVIMYQIMKPNKAILKKRWQGKRLFAGFRR